MKTKNTFLSYLQKISLIVLISTVIYSIISYYATDGFSWIGFTITLLVSLIVGVFVSYIILWLINAIFDEENSMYMSSSYIMLAVSCILLISVNMAVENASEEVSSSSYSTSETSNTNSNNNNESVGTSSYTTYSKCPKCGKTYNKESWGEMCGSCWSSGKALKCKHGRPWAECCAKNLSKP
jgi:ABC-type multidrug transport system fused ATPase/permease subunit